MKIEIPYGGWLPRGHQGALWNYLRAGGKRAMAIWHRRAGKDEVCLHHTAVSVLERPASYWHCLPEFEQGRRAIWSSVNAHTGRRRIDEVFPQEMRANTDDHGMFIRFRNGSTWQVIGSDRYNATMGAGPAGVVYSEFALANPSAWAYHRPMLEENNGWAIFITTPRGRNHAFEMSKFAQRNAAWFYELLTVRDTNALSTEALDDALAEYRALYGADVGEMQFRQEYFCDWSAGLLGAYYATEMMAVRNEGRIVDDLEAIDAPVNTAWDIGTGAETCIWFWQQVGSQIFVLDVLSSSGVGVEWYRDEVKRRCAQHGWIHGTDYVPHDAKVKEFGTGKTRVETMQSLQLKPMLVPLATVEDGVNAVRRTLPLCVFHSRCEDVGIAALEQHKRDWDDEKKCFIAKPKKDWTSDRADAFRYLALAWRRQPQPKPEKKPTQFAGMVLPPAPSTSRKYARM